MLTHCFYLNKVVFNPISSFLANLSSYNFFFFPDSLSGVSILCCPENKSFNAAELEKERAFALTDKIKAGDIEKLSEQKLYLPLSILDLVRMT
jgi:hypothetical protein